MELLKFRAVYIKIIVKNTSADLWHCGPPLTGATRLLLPGSSCRLSALVQPAPAESASPPLVSAAPGLQLHRAHKGPFSSFSPPTQSSFCRLCTAFPSTPNPPKYSSAVLVGGEHSCSGGFHSGAVSEGSLTELCKVIAAPWECTAITAAIISVSWGWFPWWGAWASKARKMRSNAPFAISLKEATAQDKATCKLWFSAWHPCPCQGTGTRWSPVSLPTQIIPWFLGQFLIPSYSLLPDKPKRWKIPLC